MGGEISGVWRSLGEGNSKWIFYGYQLWWMNMKKIQLKNIIIVHIIKTRACVRACASVRVCSCVCACARVYVRVRSCGCARASAFSRVYTCVSVCVCARVYVRLRSRACVCERARMCAHVCMCARACLHMRVRQWRFSNFGALGHFLYAGPCVRTSRTAVGLGAKIFRF